ncbi:MAG: pyridoxamine 5'-phosphate oxidase family protein [Anaerolineaceae bacterium]|nr:pyridoxamine 5'-phosphate oxidase family protein [Anaerolineaceae bacterium]
MSISNSPAVENTLQIIELMMIHPEGLTAQDFISNLNMSRSSLFQLLKTMRALGYIKQIEKRGRYFSGPRLESWRYAVPHVSRDLITSFYREVERIQWAETAVLISPSGNGLTVLAQYEGQNKVRCSYTLGQLIQNSAAGEVLSGNPESLIVVNGFQIIRDLESIELALPVCRDGVHPNAVLMISAPEFRWNQEMFLETYLNEAREVAARLSYQMGAPFYTPYAGKSSSQLKSSMAMTMEEITVFLEGPWVARLACLRPDGLPHVVPVWQEWDGECFTVISWRSSQWAAYISENPNVSITIDEPWLPLRRISARGIVVEEVQAIQELENESLTELVERMTARYLGQDGRVLTDQIETVFRIQPEQIKGWHGLVSSKKKD